jgi:hypothetical protein
MKIAILIILALPCASALADDLCFVEPCPVKQPDSSHLERQLDQMRIDAEYRRAMNEIRQREAREQRESHDLQMQQELDRQRLAPPFNLPGSPAR